MPVVTELRTSRLLLRRAHAADLEPLHAILSDARAMHYWSTAPHGDLEQTRDWLNAMMASGPGESDDFVVTLDGAVIGKMGAWRLPEIGFILAPGHWSRGLASEALAAVLVHVFARSDVERLTADVDPRNLASLSLLERHGFARTGFAERTWETHIGFCDSVYLALERTAFRGSMPG